MATKKSNPVAGGSAGLGDALSLAGSIHEHSTPSVIINRLQRQFAISELHAATVAHLAGLGPMEASHGR